MVTELRELKLESIDKSLLRDFIEVASDIYAGDPSWVRPLDFDIRDRLNLKRNPFFEHAEAGAWVAYRGGRRVGRITAQICHEHLARHADGAGFFGFLDTIHDPEVAATLLTQAERWCAARGMKSIRGPFSLSINEETGCLVDGFDTPPMLMMTHHRPYQAGLIEQAGYTKLKDFYAWNYDVGRVPARAQRAHDDIAAMPEVTTRAIDVKNLARDVRIIMDIFNDAWSDNWGFVPATEREVGKIAEDMKLVAVPELTKLVFIDGEPAAVSMGLPNVNEMVADFRGKLLPFNVLRLLWRLRVRGPRSARVFILGIRKKFRGVRRYAGLSAYLYVALNHAGHRLGIRHAELSWTLDDNVRVNAGIRMMGARVYKTYRAYEKRLG